MEVVLADLSFMNRAEAKRIAVFRVPEVRDGNDSDNDRLSVRAAVAVIIVLSALSWGLVFGIFWLVGRLF